MRLVIAAGLAISGIGAASAASAQAVDIRLQAGEVLLKVEGEGEDRSRPDTMTITAGVVTTGGNAREALQANSLLANRLIEAVRANGVEARDVRTSRLSVVPRFNQGEEDRAEQEARRPRILGYVASNEVELRLRDLSKAAGIVNDLFAAGANKVTGPNFSHADPKPAEARARRAAVADAQAEGSDYAEALGMKIARVLRVSQRGDFDRENRGEIIVTGSRIAGAPIEPGEIVTRVQVWIHYAMVPR